MTGYKSMEVAQYVRLNDKVGRRCLKICILTACYQRAVRGMRDVKNSLELFDDDRIVCRCRELRADFHEVRL